MIDLVVSTEDYDAIRSHLLSDSRESCAVLFASQTSTTDGRVRLLVRAFEFPSSDDYSSRGPLDAELRPELVARVSKRASREKLALVFAHSHPGENVPMFSPIDDRGEQLLANFMERRNAGFIHGALVVGADGARARRLGRREDIRIISVGAHRRVIFDPKVAISQINDVFDRQVRAFGTASQHILQALKVAIVGLGGTGSIVAEQLSHLGVRDYLLIDPDVIEGSNLNRVVGATLSDVGMPKVEVAERSIKHISTEARVACLHEDIIRASTARRLCDVDVIYGCTDSHGSRAVLQQVAYQYLIPCIDLGTTIAVDGGGQIDHIVGRVQMLAPGLGCFNCNNLLDPAQVRRDMMTAFERQADPYFQGAHEPAPAVISINGVVASLAVTMLLSAATGLPSPARYVLYDARRSSLRSIRPASQANCFICSRSGALARGDGWELMARQD